VCKYFHCCATSNSGHLERNLQSKYCLSAGVSFSKYKFAGDIIVAFNTATILS